MEFLHPPFSLSKMTNLTIFLFFFKKIKIELFLETCSLHNSTVEHYTHQILQNTGVLEKSLFFPVNLLVDYSITNTIFVSLMFL